MVNKVFIGIDVSSKMLDICIKEGKKLSHFKIENSITAITCFFSGLSYKKPVIAMENTGRYNWPLYEVLANKGFIVFVIPPLQLKKSLGLARGKNDKADALRIACYTEKNQQELHSWRAPSKALQKLKTLLAERSMRIRMKKQLLNIAKDYPLMKEIELEGSLSTLNGEALAGIEQQIEQLELMIESIIQTDQELSSTAALLKSVPGIGKVLCWVLLVKTNNFKTINNPRKLACYCGVVPFDHQSGTSIKWKPRVSTYADKSLKSLLHLSAMSAIRLNNDLRSYYQRKVAEGKNKMSVLNAVRNKIIHRAYAVINNQKPYQNNLVLS
jgi:transposase